MSTIPLTILRNNLFQLADQVLATGEPVIVERHRRRLAPATRPNAPSGASD